MNILITGGSSGIGLSIIKNLLSKGHRVYEISRRDFRHEGVFHVSADVTNNKQIKEAIKLIMENAGDIDICINCAGFGISGAIEFTDIEQAKRQFDVNFFGMVNINKEIIPYMRKKGKGRIINISSVAAVASIPFQAYYSASKAAINSYTLSLANELRPFNIEVCAIMPGDIKTGFTDARIKSIEGNDIYSGKIQKSVAGMEKDERNGMSPDKAASYIVKIALKRSIKPLYAIGISYKIVCVLIKILPAKLANSIIGKLYA